MPDLIPEGCISLCAAYDSFVSGLWSGHDPVAELRDKVTYAESPPRLVERSKASLATVADSMLAEVKHAFATGSLVALARPPGALENFAIPQDSWASVHFPERAFLSEKIVPGHGGYWDGLVGRTPFVRRTQFEAWLTEKVARRTDPHASPSPAHQALIDHLLGLALDGLLPSTEIERIARQWGLSPFESNPPAEKFDAVKLPRWTLCMAVSWIVWRTSEDARAAMDQYRSHCWRWVRCRRTIDLGSERFEVDGEELITLPPLNLTLLDLADSEVTNADELETLKKMSIGAAHEELWQSLGQGEFSARALDADERVSEIPAREWEHLKLASGWNGSDYLVFAHAPLRTAYSKVTVSSTAVRDRWPGQSRSPRKTDEQIKSTQLASRRIVFAVDDEARRIVFDDGPELHGKSFGLFFRLALQFRADLNSGVDRSNYGFVASRALAQDLQTLDENLRQRVMRARQSMQQQFKARAGYALDEEDVIQSSNWKGYRLNPYLLETGLQQLGRSTQTSRQKVKTSRLLVWAQTIRG
jgi:hypothetical protein